jgi:hypothetical protein
MSMNIYLEALMKVTGVKTGETHYMKKKFPCYQTPTTITYKILDSNNKYKEYCDWVLAFPDEYSKEPIYYLDYDEHDSPEEVARKYDLDLERCLGNEKIDNPIIGYRDTRIEHIKDLDDWIKQCKLDGYDELEWYTI